MPFESEPPWLEIRERRARLLPSELTWNEALSVPFKFLVVAVQVLFSDLPKKRLETG